MIIRSLKFSGIGPFKGEYAIDFDRLAADGLFLFDGPTGSGKSTLIDAVTFALFGSVAGKDSSNTRIRSTHTDPTIESWVDLVFSVSSGTYRVRRSPSWMRLKRKAKKKISESDNSVSDVSYAESDFTKVNETAKLWEINPDGAASRNWDDAKAIAVQVREVRPLIEGIIGLSKDQFLQTVILPQGQFAEFLRLKSSERKPILEAIFRTKKYSDFTAKLTMRAKKSREEIAEKKQNYQHAIQTWMTIQGIDEEELRRVTELSTEFFTQPESGAADFEEKLLAAIAAAHNTLAANARDDQKMAEKAQLAEETCRNLLGEEETLLALIEKRLTLESELKDLELYAEQQQTDLQMLNLSEQAKLPDSRIADYQDEVSKLAASQVPYLQLSEKYSASASSAAQDNQDENLAALLPEAASELTELLSAAERELLPLEVINSVQDKSKNITFGLENREKFLRKEIAKFETLCELESEIKTDEKRIAVLQQQLAKLDVKTAKIAEKIAAIPENIRKAEHRLAQCSDLAANITQLTVDFEKKIAQQEAIDTIFQIEKDLAAADTNFSTAAANLRDAKLEYAAEFKNWQNGFAAHLAAKLQDGDSCPVCGATEHPNPAKTTDNLPSESKVKSAQAKADAAQAALTAMLGVKNKFEIQLTEMKKKVSSLDSQSAANEIAKAKEALDTAAQAQDKIPAVENELTALRKKSEILHEERSTIVADTRAITAELEVITAQLSAKQQKLKQNQGKSDTIENWLNFLNNECAALEELLKSQRELTIILASLAKTAQHAIAAINESSFADQAEVEKARLTAAQKTALESKVHAYEKKLQRTQVLLSDPSLAAAAGKPKPNVAARKETLAELVSERKKSADKAAASRQFKTDSARLYPSILTAAKAWHLTIEKSAKIVRLADLANAADSQNSRIPLDMWVLLRRFEMVVARANSHLSEISNGRYELIRSEESGRVKKTGLGLNIIDRDGSPLGDTARPTTSLSGGETFYTSLALALALAEVVQEETGGVRIETLIIDEGFGTLSAGIRELVMQTLRTLQRNGRKIGIVSHVPELKQLVANRIAISPMESGESILKVIS